MDGDREVRTTALEQLESLKSPQLVAYYVKKLRDKDNVIVNRAARGLGVMKDPSAIGPLIDALVTMHKHQTAAAGMPAAAVACR